jgi:hypothetical protein
MGRKGAKNEERKMTVVGQGPGCLSVSDEQRRARDAPWQQSTAALAAVRGRLPYIRHTALEGLLAAPRSDTTMIHFVRDGSLL